MLKKTKTSFIYFFLLFFLNTINSQSLIPLRNGFSWGFANKAGKVIIPVQFEEVSPFRFGIAEARQKGKWGIINSKGEWVVPASYRAVKIMDFGFILAYERIGSRVLNKRGEEILPKGSWYIRGNKYGISFSQNGYKGIIDSLGNLILPADEYSYFGFYKYDEKEVILVEKDAIVNGRKTTLHGILDDQFNVIIPASYEKIKYLKDHKWLVYWKEEDSDNPHMRKYAIFSGENKKVVEGVFHNAVIFKEKGLLLFEMEEGAMLCDFEGRNMLGQTYSFLEIINDSTMMAGNGVAAFLIDMTGKRKGDIVFDEPYQGQVPRERGLLKVKINKKVALIDEEGRFVLKPIYDDVKLHPMFKKNNLFLFRDGKFWGLSKLGETPKIPAKYGQLEWGGGACLIAKKSRDSHGLLNYQDKVLIPFDSLFLNRLASRDQSYSGGLVRIMNIAPEHYNRFNGVANDKGQIIISPKYKSIDHFENGYSKIHFYDKKTDKNLVGLMDSLGQIVIDPLEKMYFSISHKSDGLYEVYSINPDTKEKKYGMGFFDDNSVWSEPYDFRINQRIKEEGYMIVFRPSDKKHGMLDENFNTIIPFKYMLLNYTNGRLIGRSFDNKIHRLDFKGNLLFPSNYKSVASIGDSLYYAKSGDVVLGYFDKNRKPFFNEKDIEAYEAYFLKQKKIYQEEANKGLVVEQEVFSKVEQMPFFKDEKCNLIKSKDEKYNCANKALNAYLTTKTKELKLQESGSVKAQIVIKPDGQIGNVKIKESTNTKLDTHAISVLKSMPKWYPGKQRGKRVYVRLEVEVVF